MSDLYRECMNYVAKKECPAAAMPGSIMCMINRMNSGKTHGDETRKRR